MTTEPPKLTADELAIAKSFGMTAAEYQLYRDGDGHAWNEYEDSRAAATEALPIKAALLEALAEHDAKAAS